MKKIFKKKWLWLSVVLAILLTTGIAVAAKYIMAPEEDGGTFIASTYYFRSNVMTESEDPTPVVINGKVTTVTLANGASATSYADVHVTYTVNYYVNVSGTWTLAATNADQTLAGNVYSTATLTVTPVTLDGVVYNDVLVEAVSTAPYTKTLRARIQFSYVGYTLELVREDAVITASLFTHFDPGTYTVSWASGIAPDNADENGILNDAAVGPDSVSAVLESNTAYILKFFVTDPAVYAGLENGTVQLSELISAVRE